MNKLIIIMAVFLILTACEQTNTRNHNTSYTTGLLKEGQSIPIITRKHICQRRAQIKKFNYRRITSRDKRRFLYDYITNIQSSITSKWRKPHSLQNSLSCTVRIKQRVDGCVRSIKFTACAHPVMRKSVRDAIALASPLPQAPHPDIYDDTIELNFQK